MPDIVENASEQTNTVDEAGAQHIAGDAGVEVAQPPFWFCCYREMEPHPDFPNHATHEVRRCVINPTHIKLAEFEDPNRPTE